MKKKILNYMDFSDSLLMLLNRSMRNKKKLQSLFSNKSNAKR